MTTSTRSTLHEAGAAGTLRRTAVSHIGFTVPDVAATADFYGRTIGLTIQDELADGGLRLGWGLGHHVIDLMEGEKGLAHYGFEVRDLDNADGGGLKGIAKRLVDAGRRVSDLDPAVLDYAVGAPSGIWTVDPDGTTVHFHGPVHRQGENAADPGRRPIKFQHTTLGTDDVAQMVSFFVDTVGFRISDQLEDGKFAWLRSDRDHHTLAVVENNQPGDLDHYSYDLAEWEDFKSWCDRLTEIGVDVVWGPGRHGPGNNLFVFFDDPAGNHIELSAEMEKFHDDRASYVTRQWRPVPASVNLWGGQLASWRKTSESEI